MEFSRQECWSGLPCPSPRNLADPGIKPGTPALQAESLLSEPPAKPLVEEGIIKPITKLSRCKDFFCGCTFRHWKELMEKTGVIFEMTETFTLENMFAMELHKHTDVLNEIVTSAIKEIAIEKVGLFLVIKQARKKKKNFFLIQRENLFVLIPVMFE